MQEQSQNYYSTPTAQPQVQQQPVQQRPASKNGYYVVRQEPADSDFDDYYYQPQAPQPAGPTVTINRPNQGAVAGALKEAAKDEEEPKKKKKKGFFGRH